MNAWRAMLEDMYAWCLLKKGTLRNNIMLMSSHLENCLFIFVQPIVRKITSGLAWNWCACYNAICFSVVVVRLLCYLDWILMLRVPKWKKFLTNGDRVLAGSEHWCGGCKLNEWLVIRKMHRGSASSLWLWYVPFNRKANWNNNQ